MNIAVILAGGKGQRMGAEVPKQYMPILGNPALYYPIRAFAESKTDKIVIVCAASDQAMIEIEILRNIDLKSKQVIFAEGGDERYLSVFNGLKATEIKEDDIVLIHDGARVCVTSKLIDELIELTKKKNAVIPVVPVTDTIHVVNATGAIVSTPLRSTLFAAQTPQCFEGSRIFEAYREAIEIEDKTITDDAYVYRSYGSGVVYTCPGDVENIKLTNPADVGIVEKILKNR